MRTERSRPTKSPTKFVAVRAAQPFETSYDCDKAEKAADQTAQAISDVPSLARLDRELAQHYQAYLKLLTPAERREAIEIQRAWLEERNKSCVIYKFWVHGLDEAYQKRIAALEVKQHEKASAGRPWRFSKVPTRNTRAQQRAKSGFAHGARADSVNADEAVDAKARAAAANDAGASTVEARIAKLVRKQGNSPSPPARRAANFPWLRTADSYTEPWNPA